MIGEGCFECEDGVYWAICKDFEYTDRDYGRIKVENVAMYQCDKCGDIGIPSQSGVFIDDECDKQLIEKAKEEMCDSCIQVRHCSQNIRDECYGNEG